MLSDKEKQEIRENFKKKALNDEIDEVATAYKNPTISTEIS